MKTNRLPKLFSYVVDHDDGVAPCAEGSYCTLVHCKFSGDRGRRNVVELAEQGDWVVGTGGKGQRSSGNTSTIIYAMEVTEKMTLEECDWLDLVDTPSSYSSSSREPTALSPTGRRWA